MNDNQTKTMPSICEMWIFKIMVINVCRNSSPLSTINSHREIFLAMLAAVVVVVEEVYFGLID